MRIRVLVPVLVLLSASGCASGLNRPVREVTATADAQGIQHIRLAAHSFYFEPNRVVVKANQPVELRIHNGSWIVPHNVSIHVPEAGVDFDGDVHPLGGSRTVRFTPTKPGEYPFFCDKDGHRKKGMTGTLVVTP